MGWKPYSLDRVAQELVLDAQSRDRDRKRDSKGDSDSERDSLNQSYKMRMAVPYGLERFWGEHLRLQKKESDVNKSKYWKETWDALVDLMKKAGVALPNDPVKVNISQNLNKEERKAKEKEEMEKVRAMSEKLWDLSMEDQRVAIAVLMQLCDSLVWWTQRYK